MTLQELHAIVARGEGLKTEFKRKLPEWEKLAREVVAFANTEGGTVFIGVDDDGSIPGTRDPREIEEALEIRLREFCRPAPDFRLETIPLTRKRAVVAVHVQRSRKKPHLALIANGSGKGTALIRIGDSSATASREQFQLLKYEGRERDIKVEYGDKEGALMQHLEANDWITVREFARIAGISRYVASRTLVHLVKANVLRIEPQLEREDRFSPAFE